MTSDSRAACTVESPSTWMTAGSADGWSSQRTATVVAADELAFDAHGAAYAIRDFGGQNHGVAVAAGAQELCVRPAEPEEARPAEARFLVVHHRPVVDAGRGEGVAPGERPRVGEGSGIDDGVASGESHVEVERVEMSGARGIRAGAEKDGGASRARRCPTGCAGADAIADRLALLRPRQS